MAETAKICQGANRNLSLRHQFPPRILKQVPVACLMESGPVRNNNTAPASLAFMHDRQVVTFDDHPSDAHFFVSQIRWPLLQLINPNDVTARAKCRAELPVLCRSF